MVPDLFGLTGRVALVTDASSGVGQHFSRVLASAGAHVLAAGRQVEKLDAIAGAIRAKGGRCTALELDVSSTASIRDAHRVFSQVDILVNIAGVVQQAPASDEETADRYPVIEKSLKGAVFLSRQVADALRARGVPGSIVNIASIPQMLQCADVLPNAVATACPIQLTKTLALEFARYGVRVNAIATGYFSTEQDADLWDSDPGEATIKRIPQRRLGNLADLDGPLLLLASEASRYMTGSVVTVDGGHVVSTLQD